MAGLKLTVLCVRGSRCTTVDEIVPSALHGCSGADTAVRMNLAQQSYISLDLWAVCCCGEHHTLGCLEAYSCVSFMHFVREMLMLKLVTATV